MDDISNHLGISKKTLYQYIDNKADLINQIMEQRNQKEIDAVAQIKKASKDAIEEILGITKYILKTLRTMTPSVLYDLQKYYKQTWKAIEHFHQHEVYCMIKQNLERGIQEGLYRNNLDTHVIAKLYVGKTMFVADDEAFPLKEYHREDLFQEYMNYHIHGVASEKGLQLLLHYLNLKDQSNLEQ